MCLKISNLGDNRLEVRKMLAFWRKKFKENKQRQYLSQRGYRLFYSDYFDILAVLLAVGIVGIMIWAQIGIDRAIIGLGCYLLFVVGLRFKLINRQRKKIAALVSYEQAKEAWIAECKNKEQDVLKAEVRSILAGIESTCLDELLKNGEYDLWLGFEEKNLKDLLANEKKYKGTVIVLDYFSAKDVRIIQNRISDRVVLAKWQDIFDLAVKENLVAISAENTIEEADNRQKNTIALKSSYLFSGGLLCLFLAEFSRYFYVYFLAGIFLLSLYLLSMKKSQGNEPVLLKKAIKSAKIR